MLVTNSPFNCSTVIDSIDCLDISTEYDSAVFYSGFGNRKKAEEFAEQFPGKKMLEMTPGGYYLDQLALMDNCPGVREPWHALSKRYAEQVSGSVHIFVNGSRSDSTFCITELPLIIANPKVTSIISYPLGKSLICGKEMVLISAPNSTVDGGDEASKKTVKSLGAGKKSPAFFQEPKFVTAFDKPNAAVALYGEEVDNKRSEAAATNQSSVQ